jgi:hypothetical protein
MRDAIGALPAPRWDEKLPSGWTLKEVVGHLAYGESTVPAFVDSLRNGTAREGDADVDELNARAAAEVRGLLPDEVLCRWDDAHAEMLEVARDLTGDLAAAIKDKDDLLALVQTSWTPYRLAIGAIGLPSLEEKTWTGWTYKDLVAPAAAWEDRAPARLETFRERGAKTYPGVDRRLLETLRGLPPGDADEKIASSLPYYTYLHWEEHFAELGISL